MGSLLHFLCLQKCACIHPFAKDFESVLMVGEVAAASLKQQGGAPAMGGQEEDSLTGSEDV